MKTGTPVTDYLQGLCDQAEEQGCRVTSLRLKREDWTRLYEEYKAAYPWGLPRAIPGVHAINLAFGGIPVYRKP